MIAKIVVKRLLNLWLVSKVTNILVNYFSNTNVIYTSIVLIYRSGCNQLIKYEYSPPSIKCILYKSSKETTYDLYLTVLQNFTCILFLNVVVWATCMYDWSLESWIELFLEPKADPYSAVALLYVAVSSLKYNMHDLRGKCQRLELPTQKPKHFSY